MLSLPTTVRIFAAVEPVDLRKGFDALACLVRQVIVDDPLSGHLFVFMNRRADRIKVLFWTRNGYCVLYKRLGARPASFADAHTAGWLDRVGSRRAECTT